MIKRIRKSLTFKWMGFITRRLTHPIKQLSAQMTKVSEGNFDVDIDMPARDEVGLLTKSFNQMIQDLKKSHEALKEAEEKYHKIFENSKDMVFISSSDGRLIDVNQAGVDMLGYESKEALLKISARDTYFQPEDRKTYQNEMTKDGFVKDFEVQLKRKDGTPIDCLITATGRKDAEGHIIGYEGIIKDISTRKRIEEELFQRTEELQALYDLSALINQTLDLEEILPIALDKALSLARFEIGGIYLFHEEEKTLKLKSHKGYSSVFADKVKVMQYGEGVSGKAIELKQPILLSIDEYPFPQFLPILKEEGIQSLVGIPLLAKGKAVGSITLGSRCPHVLAQREIHLLENIGNQIGIALENAKLFSNAAMAKSEWEATFDSVTDLITIHYKDYRILRANKAALKRFRMEPKELIGRKCYKILYHREIPCDGCHISETLETKRPAFGERMSDYLGGVFQSYTFPIFDGAGEVIAVVVLARDVTEQKRQEMEKEIVNNINKIMASSLDVREVMKAVHSELKRV